MFYSHEILTSREYGVATVWLVATLGAKSTTTKKLTRKAILDVDVPKACKTILQPVVPLALPLSSNLLYGVSRVYSQQCSYVLADAQTAQNSMRALMRVIRNKDIDQEAGQVRRDQLVLLDDPAFIAETELPSLELDFSVLDLDKLASHHSSISMLTPRHRTSSDQSMHRDSLSLINLDSSVMSAGYHLPRDPFATSSAQKYNDGARPIFDDEQVLFQDDGDLDFGFDADGNLVDRPFKGNEAMTIENLVRTTNIGGEADSVAKMREHLENAQRPRGWPIDAEGDVNMNFEHNEIVLPDAEAFPMMRGALHPGIILAQSQVDSSIVYSTSPSSAEVEALLSRRKSRGRKMLEFDAIITLQNKELSLLSENYNANMSVARQARTVQKEARQAKKNAAYLLVHIGLGGVGATLARDPKFVSPLAQHFSGPALISSITGRPIAVSERGNKRASDPQISEVQTPKRRRLGVPEDELPMGLDEFGPLPQESDSSIELGREAPTDLQDYASSAVMPWNVSVSLRSKTGSSLPGSRALSHSQSHAVASQSRRILSASPLFGRGPVGQGDLAQLNQAEEVIGDNDAAIMYGRSDKSSPGSGGLGFGHVAGSKISSSQHARKEYELFGVAAGVDTQTAGQSQWLRDTLDRESMNFLEFLTTYIGGKDRENLEGGDEWRGEQDKDKTPDAESDIQTKRVSFEELFEPEKNTTVVAAQAFYHVLTLATKGLLRASQEVRDDAKGQPQPWGKISLRVVL